MSVIGYIVFENQTESAIEFYKQVFDLKVLEIMKMSDAPEDENNPLPESIKNLIMHAEIELFGSRIMLSDSPKDFGREVVKGNNFSLAICTDDKKAMTNAWNKLKIGAQINIELGPQFFSELYGRLVDKFGISWQFIYEK
ncbi:MAG: glyoxalase/bleomycin resistance/extradiol dioxygenase family protein [Acholeplasmataceae bacterium]|nr:glyoxalase/bleomycin resistance/extradiol dioxygenase family protein [Acholeplasmataceae bacterium]